jgi:adenosylmethionine-8-amino-7-oxononanoate aminotransferase
MDRPTAIKDDLDYLWHPYTQMKDATQYPPILIEKAQGLRRYHIELVVQSAWP